MTNFEKKNVADSKHILPTKEELHQKIENGVIDKIKRIFEDVKKFCEYSNNKMKYNEHDLQQADQSIKKLSEMRIVSRTILTKIDGMKKLPNIKKLEFQELINSTLVNFNI